MEISPSKLASSTSLRLSPEMKQARRVVDSPKRINGRQILNQPINTSPHLRRAYQGASPQVRRQINQAFYRCFPDRR